MTDQIDIRAAAALAVFFLVPAARAQQDPSVAGGVEERAARMLEAADEVAREVEDLRGWKFKHPVRKDVRTEAQLRTYIEKKLLEREYGGGRLARTEAWLKLLDMMPSDASFAGTLMDVLISQIGGFYDPDEKAFFMMAESARFGDTVNRMLIAHELCHALDDQHVDLAPLLKGKDGEPLTEDASFAIGGLVEGSATALMMAWMQRKMQAGAVDVAEMLALQKAEAERNRVLLEAPRYFTLIVANYMVGQHFITKGKRIAAQGAAPDTGAAVREAAQNPPRSAEQILHPEKYWQAESRDEPVQIANDDEVAARIARDCGAVVLERNTLGELICALFSTSGDRKLNLVLVAQPSYWTNKYARGWGGDRLYLVGAQQGDGPVAGAGAVWVTAWDTVEERAEFVAGVRRARGEGLRIVEGGRVAVFGFGACAAEELDLEAVRGLTRFAQDGAPWDAAVR